MLWSMADENLNGDIVRGLFLRQSTNEVVRVQDAGLAGADDQRVLEWAAANRRIVLTHDRATLADRAFERVTAGQEMSGVFILNDRLPVKQAIDEILLMIACSEQAEWRGRVVYLPL